MVDGFYNDYNQSNRINWNVGTNQSIDHTDYEKLQNAFQAAVVRAVDPAPASDDQEFGQGHGDQQNSGMADERGAYWPKQSTPYFDAESAREQFHKTFGTGGGYRPVYTKANGAPMRGDGVTLRKDVIDLDFEDVVEDGDRPTGVRRIPGSASRPPLRLGSREQGHGGGQGGGGQRGQSGQGQNGRGRSR